MTEQLQSNWDTPPLDGHLNTVLSPLQILHNIEHPGKVFDAIIKDVELLERKQLLTSNIDDLAARVDLPSADIWRCFNSLLQLREYVNSSKLTLTDLNDILLRHEFSDEVVEVIIRFAGSEQPHKLALASAPSKYPPFRSLQCRLQITIGRMTLLHAPDVMLQFWLHVGGGDGADDERSNSADTTARHSGTANEEKIFVMDYGMLSRLIEEIEKITSIACKLERLHLK